MKPFETRGCSQYGAQMGRRSDPLSVFDGVKVHLVQVKMYDGCYDKGGAYWGSPEYDHTKSMWIVPPLYCVWDDSGHVAYFRAHDRAAAKSKVTGAKFYR